MSSLGPEFTIRRAELGDADSLGRLGAALMHTHYAFDASRFLAPGDDAEAGYAAFLASQLAEPDSVVLVAERGGTVVGYVYAGIEPMSWKELRDECGFVHDLLVADTVQRAGVGDALLAHATEWLRDRGMPRVILWASPQNDRGRRLFERRGFRPTMIEMTLEL